jgi:hypothetical protein
VLPGARLENITNLADEEVSMLRKSDAVIVIGGANYINKNETNVGLKHLRKFIKNGHNTNIMIVTAHHRYDLQEILCVNKEIEVFNRKLHKVVNTADNVKIIQVDLSRNDFTHHGLHLNTSEKEKMAKLIGVNIKTNVKKIRNPFHSEIGKKSKGPCSERS